MTTLVLILLVVSLVCFLIAMANVGSRVNLIAAGLAAYVLSLLVTHIH